MDVTNVLQKLRTLAIEDQTMYDLIETRFYPHPIQLEETDQQLPLINIRLLSSANLGDRGRYPVTSYLFDCYFISGTSIDEANAAYSRFYDIINNNRYTLDDGVMVVREDTGVMDASGIYGSQYLYILSNTLEVRKIQ